MMDEPLPPELAEAAMRVDELVRLFEDHPDPLVRDQVVALLQAVDALHRAGLRRVADLLQAAGLERRALDDPEVRLLYTLYDLGEDAAVETTAPTPAAAPQVRASFVPLSNLLGGREPHG
jgi:hypothetical protein